MCHVYDLLISCNYYTLRYQPMRVLAVDDDFMILKAVKRLLFRHETRIASDSATAIVIAKRFLPDIIAIDVELMGECGFDAVPALRAASPSSMMVVVTGTQGWAVRNRAVEIGARAFVGKADLHLIEGMFCYLVGQSLSAG